MDPKLAIMFLLIGAVLTLSSFEGGMLDRARQQIKRTIRNGRYLRARPSAAAAPRAKCLPPPGPVCRLRH